MEKYAALFALAALASFVLTPVARLVAERIGAVDEPDERRVHRVPTPRLGGVAIFAATALGLGLIAFASEEAWSLLGSERIGMRGLFVAAALVVVMGVLDDVWSLRPSVKLLTQVAAAGLVVASGYNVDALFGVELGLLGVFLTVFWVVAVTNAFNLLDGLDGLAAGVGVIVCATMFWVSFYSGNFEGAFLVVALGGALVGFLRYNFHPASIFLGDSGSLFLGFTLSVVSISAPSRPSAVLAILVPILALGLPLMDTAVTTIRRFLRAFRVVRLDQETERYEFLPVGRTALFTADREHIHHRLLGMGLSHRNAVLVLYAVAALFCLGAFALVMVRVPQQGFLLAAFGVAAFVGIRQLGYGEMQVLKSGVLLPVFESPIVSRRVLRVLVDLCFVIGSYLAAHLVLNDFAWDDGARRPFLDTVPAVALVQIGALVAAGLYRGSYRYTGLRDLLVMLRGIALAVAGTYVGLYALGGFEAPSTAVVVLDGYLLATFVIGARISFRVLDLAFKEAQREGGRRTLLYGAGNGGVLALREIQGNPALRMVAVGFVDDDPRKKMRLVQGVPVHGSDDVEELLRRREFDELVVTSTKIPEEKVRSVAERCALAGIPVRRFRIGWEDLSVGRRVGDGDGSEEDEERQIGAAG